MRRDQTHLGVNLDWVEEKDRVVLSEGEGVDVGELGRLEGGYNLGSLISVLGPVPQHLHPGWSGDALPVVEVDRVVRAGLAHPVSTTVEGERVGGRVFLSDSG